jgi:hypothetical protein
MKYLIIALVLSVYTFTFLQTSPIQADEDLQFCTYTATVTIRNDKNGGREIYSFWNGMQFPIGTPVIINGEVVASSTYTYSGDVVMHIPANATATTSVSITASAPPSYYGIWAVFDLTLPSPYFTDATLIGQPLLTSDCAGPLNKIMVEAVQASIVPSFDWGGDSAGLKVWAVDSSGSGQTTLELSPDFLASLPANVETNTEFAVSDDGLTRFYLLDTGEYQINFGPDHEGKVSVVVFDRGFNVTNSYQFQLGK